MRAGKIAIGISFVASAGLLAWAIWGPLLNFFFSLVPQNDWARLIKFAIAAGVGYCIGISFPLALAAIGVWFCFA